MSAATQAAVPKAAGASRQTSVALKAAFNIAELWGITDTQLAILLGGVPVPTLRRWKRQLRTAGQVKTELSRDQLDRISYLLGIYKALHILFPDARQADAWPAKRNEGVPFRGRTALEVMLQGSMNDLQAVRRYVDAWRG